MTDVLLGGSLLASFLAGMIALFAPCCISVMLPAYFASSFDRRRALVAMTFLFAAGVALIILPIALGAAAIGAAINQNHFIIYLVGGLLMLALGVFMLAGGKLRLPMPGVRARERRGPLSVVSLGAFSGIASACCAPVLAGVLALSGISGSFSAALLLGVAYVFGMVFPLFVIALLWDRFNWGESRLLRGRTFRPRLLGRELALQSTALASGLLMLVIGVIVIVIAFSGSAMPNSGWQVEVSARLQHYAHVLTEWGQTLPGWLTGIAILAGLAALAWKALGQAGGGADDNRSDDASGGEGGAENAEERPAAASAGARLEALEPIETPALRRTSVEWQNR